MRHQFLEQADVQPGLAGAEQDREVHRTCPDD
jgi:hypothetical protein